MDMYMYNCGVVCSGLNLHLKLYSNTSVQKGRGHCHASMTKYTKSKI